MRHFHKVSGVVTVSLIWVIVAIAAMPGSGSRRFSER